MEANINANKESPEFSNFDRMTSPLDGEKEEIKVNKTLGLKFIIIISVIILSIILLIVLIVVLNKKKECESGYYLPEDDKSNCQKCSVDNCDKCSGTKDSNVCSSCISTFFPIHEDNILKSCNPCNEGCLNCNQETHECLSCEGGYNLSNGICYLSYSFKAKYYVDSESKDVNLINSNFKKNTKSNN